MAGGGVGGTTAGNGGGGAGGTTAGNGGNGGAPVGNVCDGAGWMASALISGPGAVDPPSNAIDRDADMNASRFSTGRPMTVNDWLQVDFGQSIDLDSVSIRWAGDDFARAFDIRLSDTPLAHASAATVAGAVGVAGTQTVDLPGHAAGRYLLVTLTSTGGSTKWWSIQNVAVACSVDGGEGGAGGEGGSPPTGEAGAGGQAGAGGEAGAPGSGANDCVTAADCDDDNPCTTNVCTDGACSFPADNAATCSDDDACTIDSCAGGACTSVPDAACVCDVDQDCPNDNACLDVSCVDHHCVTEPNDAPCADDNNPCTDDICSEGSCGLDTGLCVGSDLVLIRVNRPQQANQHVFVNAADSILISTGTRPTATIFEQVYLEASKLKFKLKEIETGAFVGIGANERMFANATVDTAMIFGAPDCGAPYVGLFAYGDDDNARTLTAEANGFLEATRGVCAPDNVGSWEKFELQPLTAGCKLNQDCDDANPCTSEVCTAGQCVFTDQPATTTCADDAKACTDDICMNGLCVHQDNGSCGSSIVTIRTNRDSRYLVLNPADGFLEWTAALLDDAALFELVDQVGTQFKLRAENGMFVTLNGIAGTTDELVANASYVDAVTFDNAACGTKQSFQALDDVDTNRFVQTPTGITRLRAVNGICGLTATSWEQFEFTPLAVP